MNFVYSYGAVSLRLARLAERVMLRILVGAGEGVGEGGYAVNTCLVVILDDMDGWECA